jgi:hypothetical protein
MCRFRIAIVMYATVFLGLGIAQTVSSDTADDLKIAWKKIDKNADSGVMHCLKALDLYTRDGASYDPDDALKELLLAANPDKAKFYRAAQKLGKMPELLATARSIESNGPTAVDKLFIEVGDSISAAYKSDPEGLDKYVNKEYFNNPARALYNLLNALLPAWDPAKAKDAAELMEKYRTCYALDRNRLFGLVSAHFQ